jgi:hypothetical protein
MKRNSTFWLLQVPGWLLFLYLVYAQAIPAFSYQAGVQMGTQEPAAVVTEVGVAFWKGFALADLLVYIPLLAIGLAGHWRGVKWGDAVLGAALGITVYWPVVCLSALVAARRAQGWNIGDETAYWVVLPLITCWAAWGLWQLVAASGFQSDPSR